jgi:hypothetical protein
MILQDFQRTQSPGASLLEHPHTLHIHRGPRPIREFPLRVPGDPFDQPGHMSTLFSNVQQHLSCRHPLLRADQEPLIPFRRDRETIRLEDFGQFPDYVGGGDTTLGEGRTNTARQKQSGNRVLTPGNQIVMFGLLNLTVHHVHPDYRRSVPRCQTFRFGRPFLPRLRPI